MCLWGMGYKELPIFLVQSKLFFFCPNNQLWPELLILGIQVHSICMYGRNCNTTGLNCMSHFGLQFFFKMCKILFDYTRELMIGYKKKEVDKKNKNIWKQFKSCQIIQHI